MAAFLSDEELISQFSDQEREFYNWTNKNRDAFAKVRWRILEIHKLMRQQWPDEETQKKFRAWHTQWTGRHFDRLERVVSADEFIDRVREINFRSTDGPKSLNFMLEMLQMPSFLLGQSKFGGVTTGYALKPCVRYLWSNLDNSPNETGVVDRNILAINLNVKIQPPDAPQAFGTVSARNRRAQNTSDDSVRSGDSDETQHQDSIMFAQIGRMFFFAGPDWTGTRGDADAVRKGPWEETQFGVVVQIDRHGRPGAVWVIYNFFEADPQSEDDTPVHISVYKNRQHRIPFPHIGRPAEGVVNNSRFTIAKIADDLKDLKTTNRIFTFDIKCKGVEECQIVRVKTTPDGKYLVPLYVGTSR